MEEENGRQNPEPQATADLGKFKSVEALVHAYKELEAEFTRRSQKLKALEERASEGGMYENNASKSDEGDADGELYRSVTENERVKSRVVSDYLSSLKGVPLMTGGGAGLTAPAVKPKSIREAGSLALGYFQSGQK